MRKLNVDSVAEPVRLALQCKAAKKNRDMNLRTLAVLTALTSGLTLIFAPRVAADPTASAGDHHYRRHLNGDSDHNQSRPPSQRNHRVYRRNDSRYSKLVDRINHDHAKIAEIESTGRNRKALQWYQDDLRNAERDMHEYRDHRTSNDRYFFGPYYDFSLDGRTVTTVMDSEEIKA